MARLLRRPWPVVLGPVLIFLAAAVPARVVTAQSCAMLGPGVPGEGPEAAIESSRAAAAAVAMQLSSQGVTVISASDARRRMTGEPFANCNALDCGPNVVRSLGVNFAVLVTLWAPRGNPTSVVVALIGAEDSAAGDAPVESNDLIAATMTALRIAQQRWQTSQMGFLNVTSTPSGANVEIDGRLAGQTPLRHLVMAGERRVRVLLDGYLPSEELVVVEATEEHRVELTLVAGEAVSPGSTEPPTDGAPSILNFLVGGGLSALGVGLLIPPIHGFAVDGSCVGSPPCAQVHQFGTVNGVLLGLGVASLATGVVFMAAQPLRVSVSAAPGSAQLDFEGNF